VSLHVPLTAETYHYIDAAALRTMKPNAILINTARGPVVDTLALYEALKAQQIFAAGLNVTDPEPLPAEHPLYTLDNALVVPHIASASFETCGPHGRDGCRQPAGRARPIASQPVSTQRPCGKQAYPKGCLAEMELSKASPQGTTGC
jgi:hypothetical protein